MEKLNQIENGLSILRDASRQNEQLTVHLVGILDSFEDRIGRLQDTILPVYQQTETLRLKQQNLEKTLKLVDEVINYYNVSKDMDAIIKNGPSGSSLHDFLNAMSSIENAVKYFEVHNSQSVELENLLSLYNTGGDALNKEFRDMLTRYSKVLPSVAILEMIEDDQNFQQNSSMSMPEHVQGDLKKIAEWLMFHNFDSYMNVYASIRSNVLLRSVQCLKDYQKASSLTMASPSTGSAVPSPSSPVLRSKFRQNEPNKKGRIQYVIEKRASKMLQRATAAVEHSTGIGLGSKKLEVKDDSVTDRESENFLILATAMLKLMQIESQLMLGVIPMQHRQKIFEIISRDSFDVMFTDGDNIASRIKKSISRREYSAILTIFPIIRCLQTLQPGFDEIFVGSFASTKANKLTSLLKTFQSNGMKALEDFIENVRDESTSQLPSDGTVHELTSNVLMFLEHLSEYMHTVAGVLAQDPNYNTAPSGYGNKTLDENLKKLLLGSYIKRVLQQLNLTLVTCSDLYYEHSIKAIFRLNNACYILKCLQGSILLDLLKTKEPDCQQNYIDMMDDQKKQYLIATWKKVEDRLYENDIPVAVLQAGKLRDKDRQVIKDKFSSFNRELDEILRLQVSYAVPDAELRVSLRRASREYIFHKYKGFYDKYKNVPFTKNNEKYIRYNPQNVSDVIDSFFNLDSAFEFTSPAAAQRRMDETPEKMRRICSSEVKEVVTNIIVENLKLPKCITEDLEDRAVRCVLQELFLLAEECLRSVSSIDVRAVSRGVAHADLTLQYVWEHFNVGHWKHVNPVWRKVYSYLTLYKIVFIVSSEQNCLRDLIKLSDLGLLMGDNDMPGNVLSILATTFHKMQSSQVFNDSELSNGNNIKQCPINSAKEVPNDNVLKNHSPNRFFVNTLEKPSLETFNNNHMFKEEPVILSQVISHWPALGKWSPKYICKIAGCRTVPVEIGSKYTADEWTQKLLTIEEFVAAYMTKADDSNESNKVSKHRESKKIGYMAQHQLFTQIPELKQDIRIPEYCLLGDNKDVEVNAWFGPCGTVSPTHYDPKHNLLAQVFGRKVVRLFPPTEKKFLLPYESDSLLFNTSRIDVEDPELFQNWPDMKCARYADIILEPGDVLYIPPKWWHFVKSLSPSFSVSFWFE